MPNSLKIIGMRKKILLGFLLTFICHFAYSQWNVRPRMGVRAGFNFSSISNTSTGGVDDKSLAPAFNIGVFSDVPVIGDFLYYQPVIQLTGKGVKYSFKSPQHNTNASVKLNPYYLEAQNNLVIKLPIGFDLKVVVGAGLYGSIGVFGNGTVKGEVNGVDISHKESIHYTNNARSSNDYSDLTRMRRFDIGLNLIGGVELSRIYIYANYEHGWADVHPGIKKVRPKFGKNRSFQLSIAYTL